MSPLETLLVSAIMALCGAIGILWKQNNGLHASRRADNYESSKLIFALLQKLAMYRGERPPPTVTDWTDEPTTQVTNAAHLEAKELAHKELNGDIETLVKQYLSGVSTPKPKRYY